MNQSTRINQIRQRTELASNLAGAHTVCAVRDDMLYLLDELDKIYAALNTCGIGGIYDAFNGPVDAITQMVDYIKSFEGEKS